MVPPSLASADLQPLWAAIRARLERRDGTSLGRIVLPTMPSAGRLTLTTLLGKPPGKTLDLAALESALLRIGVGQTLADSLAVLGFAVSPEPQARRDERRRAVEARREVRAAVEAWPDDWRGDWVDQTVRAGIFRGLDASEAVRLAASVRRLLDRVDQLGSDGPHAGGATPLSRVDLAAGLFGDAHTLDAGTRLEAAAARALGLRFDSARRAEVWEHAGVHLDLTSAPVLTWRLPVAPHCRLAPVIAAATDAGLPLHLSQFALRRYAIKLPPGSEVLVVENPRIVEAAAQRNSSTSILSINGNPSTAARLALTQLIAADARLHYHGDFDAPGLAICGRMHSLGLRPWRMTARDYEAAVAEAHAAGIALPHSTDSAPPTPWDPALRAAFDRHRLIVHEERLLATLLAG